MIRHLLEGKRLLSELGVQYVKGVGPRRSEALAAAGIVTAMDLLYYLPRKYLDRTRIYKIRDAGAALLIPDEVTFVGRVKSVNLVRRGRGRSMMFLKLADETAVMRCVWFNAVQYFVNAFKEGELIAFPESIGISGSAMPYTSGLRPSGGRSRRGVPPYRRNHSCLSDYGGFTESRAGFARAETDLQKFVRCQRPIRTSARPIYR